MAAVAGSAHIMYSIDRKPDRKGWDRTHHNSTTLFLKNPLSLSSIDWPPEVLLKTTNNPPKKHSTHNTKMGTLFPFHLLTGHRKSSRRPQTIPPKSTAPTTPKWAQLDCHHSTSQHKQLTSLPAWVEQLHLLTTTPTSRLHCLSLSPTVNTIPLV